MQIFTLDDLNFPELVSAWHSAEVIGKFWKNGQVRVIRASNQFVLISADDTITKLAVKPAKNLFEAQQIAKQLLVREKKRGNRIEEQNL